VTRRRPLPGAMGIEQARRRLAAIPALGAPGRERLINVYGGRAAGILDLADAEPELRGTLAGRSTVLRAEVAHAAREELAMTLIDIVHRRLMIGLDSDQGVSCSGAVAEIAARELGWSAAELRRQLGLLRQYNERLRPAFLHAAPT
ncbi:MAG: glycerol-3-phosphate dehydrogenase C-terminal domain-containing protein, partial [Woeseiaceae bacterium]